MSVHFDAPTQGVADMFTALGVLVDECKLVLEDGELSTEVTDPTNVANVEATLPTTVDDGEFIAGVQTAAIETLTTTPLAGERVGAECRRSDRKMWLNTGPLQRTLNLIDTDSIRRASAPDLDFPCEVTTTTDHFTEALAYLDEDGGDSVLFEYDEGKLALTSEAATGDAAFETTRVTPIEDESAVTLQSMDYLTDIAEVIPENRTLSIRIKDEYPLELSWPIGPNGEGEVSYIQAPRVRGDDD